MIVTEVRYETITIRKMYLWNNKNSVEGKKE